jgi:hypothetical protein
MDSSVCCTLLFVLLEEFEDTKGRKHVFEESDNLDIKINNTSGAPEFIPDF